MPARTATTPKPRRRSSDLRRDLLTRITRAADPEGFQGFPAGQFIRGYYNDVDIVDLQHGDPRQLARDAQAHLEFAVTRRPGRAKVRVYNPDEANGSDDRRHSVIEVVNDDMPFLIDSMSMAIDASGLGIDLTVHPIFHAQRNGNGQLTNLRRTRAANGASRPESFARFLVQRIVSHEEQVALANQIRSTLADVRAAVKDWSRMHRRMTKIHDALKQNPPALDSEELLYEAFVERVRYREPVDDEPTEIQLLERRQRRARAAGCTCCRAGR